MRLLKQFFFHNSNAANISMHTCHASACHLSHTWMVLINNAIYARNYFIKYLSIHAWMLPSHTCTNKNSASRNPTSQDCAPSLGIVPPALAQRVPHARDAGYRPRSKLLPAQNRQATSYGRRPCHWPPVRPSLKGLPPRAGKNPVSYRGLCAWASTSVGALDPVSHQGSQRRHWHNSSA